MKVMFEEWKKDAIHMIEVKQQAALFFQKSFVNKFPAIIIQHWKEFVQMRLREHIADKMGAVMIKRRVIENWRIWKAKEVVYRGESR